MPSIVCNPRDLSSEPSIQISTSVMTNKSGIEDTVEDLLGDAITFQPPLDTNQEWSNDLCSLFPKFAEESSTKNATTSYDVSTLSENIDRRDNMGEIKKRIIATEYVFI